MQNRVEVLARSAWRPPCVEPVNPRETNLVFRVCFTDDEEAGSRIDRFNFAFYKVAVVVGVGPIPNLVLQRVALILTQVRHACTTGEVTLSWYRLSARIMRYGSTTLKSAVDLS